MMTRNRSNVIRLSRTQQAWIYATSALLFGSGILWILADLYLTTETSYGTTKSPVVPLILQVHGAAAMLFLIVLGSLIPGHMKGGWMAKRNHRNGIVFVALNVILVLTGYALYYAAAEDLRLVAHWVHLVLGVAAAPALGWHVFLGRRWGKRT